MPATLLFYAPWKSRTCQGITAITFFSDLQSRSRCIEKLLCAYFQRALKMAEHYEFNGSGKFLIMKLTISQQVDYSAGNVVEVSMFGTDGVLCSANKRAIINSREQFSNIAPHIPVVSSY